MTRLSSLAQGCCVVRPLFKAARQQGRVAPQAVPISSVAAAGAQLAAPVQLPVERWQQEQQKQQHFEQEEMEEESWQSISVNARERQVDGKRNPKVQSIFLEDMPIHRAAFSADGRHVIAAGRRKWFYSYDLVAGKVQRVGGIVGRDERSLESFQVSPDGELLAFLGNDGYVSLVSQRTHQWVANLKMNGSARAAAFSPDGLELATGGGDGEVYHWDLRTRRCIHKARDAGAVQISSLALSPPAAAAGREPRGAASAATLLETHGG
eukprot:jgi/Mesen1/5266/ME000263S04377